MNPRPIEEFVNAPRKVKVALVVINELDSLRRKGCIKSGPVKSTPEGAEMASRLKREGLKATPEEVLYSLKAFRVPPDLLEPFCKLVLAQLDGQI